MVRRLLWDDKIPGTSVGIRVAAAPGLTPAGLLQDSWKRARSMAPSLANREDRATPGWTWMLEVAGENKNEVPNAQGLYPPTDTVDASWVITREIGEPGDTWKRSPPMPGAPEVRT